MYSVFFKFPVESSTYIYILKDYFPMAIIILPLVSFIKIDEKH